MGSFKRTMTAETGDRLALADNAAAPAAPPALMDAISQQAQVEQGVTAATFRVPRATDVPSDGEPHRQMVASASLPAVFTYETTPKVSPFAYLKAAATNSTDTPLLAGAVNIFHRPRFHWHGPDQHRSRKAKPPTCSSASTKASVSSARS